ncbi:unnamed protein product, partial [Iphiclides podalirius]
MGLEAGQPPAANMRKMYWDYELEEMAEVWARQCQKRHDECRNTIRFNALQNMDVRPVVPRVTEAQLLADAVGAWFSGSRSLPPENVWSFKLSNCSAPGGCNAHWYTAAAWAPTWRLGCSQALCTVRKPSCVLFRKRRRTRQFELNSDSNEPKPTPTTTENIVRRTRYMTPLKSSRFEDFATTFKDNNNEESPLYRGFLDNLSKRKRRELKIVAFTFCNYGPAGNIEGFPIYEAGTTCEKEETRNVIRGKERDRKIHEGDLARQKRRYSRDIRQLRKDIATKRQELGVAVYGDKQFMRNAFQEHRRLQLTYMNSPADKVLESIHQENFNKRKQLDRIRYTKKKKMEKFRKTQDSSYFTVVLEALKLDCRAQGKCLMGATEMGQLAMEYLDDRKFEFNKLEKEIKANMKERERTLKIVRREVAYLTESFPDLIRKEEATNLDDLYEEQDNASLHSVHWELEEVMSICKRLQRGTLVSSFDQILLRLKEQRYQSDRLMMQLTQNSLKRDALIEDRKHAILMLDSLKNVGQERTAQYVLEKGQLRAALEAEQREEKNLTKALHEKGKLIIEMKTSLQQINQLLSSVGAPSMPRPASAVPAALQYALDDAIQPVPELEADLDKLISNARQKLNVLVQAISKMDVTGDIRAQANQFYHNILARSMRDSYKEETVAEGGLIEFEIEDPNVPSHAVIKLRSKQLVDAQVSEFDVVEQPSKK